MWTLLIVFSLISAEGVSTSSQQIKFASKKECEIAAAASELRLTSATNNRYWTIYEGVKAFCVKSDYEE